MSFRRSVVVSVVVAATLLMLQPGSADSMLPGGTFVDDDLNPHESMIEAIAAEGFTLGCGGDKYCPRSPVSRGQAAAFIARSFVLPSATQDYFTDDNGTIHETDINRVAEAGISLGFEDETFRPGLTLTRAQMASLLARAMGLELEEEAVFVDVSGAHASAINALHLQGVTNGCDTNEPRFCPADDVLRDQLASFLGRALDLAPLTPPLRIAGNVIVAHGEGVSVIVGTRIVPVIVGVDVAFAIHDGTGGIVYQVNGNLGQVFHRSVASVESKVLIDGDGVDVILLDSGRDDEGDYVAYLRDPRPPDDPFNADTFDLTLEVVHLDQDVQVVVDEFSCGGDRFSNWCAAPFHASAAVESLLAFHDSDENSWHTQYRSEGASVVDRFLLWKCCEPRFSAGVLAPDAQSLLAIGPGIDRATVFNLDGDALAEVAIPSVFRDDPDGGAWWDYDGSTIVLTRNDRQVITLDMATGQQTTFDLFGRPVFGFE